MYKVDISHPANPLRQIGPGVGHEAVCYGWEEAEDAAEAEDNSVHGLPPHPELWRCSTTFSSTLETPQTPLHSPWVPGGWGVGQ